MVVYRGRCIVITVVRYLRYQFIYGTNGYVSMVFGRYIIYWSVRSVELNDVKLLYFGKYILSDKEESINLIYLWLFSQCFDASASHAMVTVMVII